MAQRPVGARDKELVQAFQGGEISAYDALYRRHAQRIESLCFQILQNRDDAEEATQETFLRAYEALGRFNGEYRVAAWLKRIATNVCFDRVRRRARRPQTIRLTHDDHADRSQLEGVAVRASLFTALRHLHPHHASAIRLRAVEDLSYDEMAKRLQMSPTQVKSLLYRARASLRNALRSMEGWAVAPFGALLRALPGGGLVAERVTAVAAVTCLAAVAPGPPGEHQPTQPPAGRSVAPVGAESAPGPAVTIRARAGAAVPEAHSGRGPAARERRSIETTARAAVPAAGSSEASRPATDALTEVTGATGEAARAIVEGVVPETLDRAVDEVVGGMDRVLELPLARRDSPEEPAEDP